MLFTQLVMSSGNLFHKSRALGKKEYIDVLKFLLKESCYIN